MRKSLLIFILGMICFSLACAPKILPASVCPQIPLPPRPTPTHVGAPALSPDGLYCFTQEEVDDIANGIADMKEYSDILEAGVKAFNKAYATDLTK